MVIKNCSPSFLNLFKRSISSIQNNLAIINKNMETKGRVLYAKLTIKDQALAAAYHDNVTDSLKPTILSTSLSSSSLYIPNSFLKYIPNAKVYSKAQREDRQL